MSTYTVNSSTMTDIADAVRGLTKSQELMTPAQIAAKIRSAKAGAPWAIDVGDDTPWVRPSDWPDLDSITIGANEEVAYLTYDLRKTPGYGWCGLYCAVNGTGAKWIIERGHLANGAFVADTHTEQATKTRYIEMLDQANGDVQLFRITSTSGQITQLSFASEGSSNTTCTSNFAQPCVERAGRLPYVSTLTGTRGARTTYYCNMTSWLEKDSLAPGELAKPTSLTSIYASAYRLRVVDFSRWKTANWDTMANISSMFSGCYSLREVDFTGLDTSKWVITTIASLFSACYALKRINMTSWDTSTWAVTTVASTFANCYSLEELDLTGWDTENWAVTTMASMFQYCRSLRSVDMRGWDTSNWAVTTMVTLFGGCWSLQDIKWTGWDTSDWEVTTIANMFDACYSLVEMVFPAWVVKDWPLTTIASLFINCYSLKHVDFSAWNTKNWEITTLATVFSGCWSLEEIDLDSWDTSNWAVTTVASMFATCYSLKRFSAAWDTTEWPLATLTSWFQNCYGIREIDLSALDGSNWPATTCSTLTQNDYNLVTLKLPEDAGPATTVSNMHAANYSLEHYWPLQVNAAWTLSGFTMLTRESLLRCIDMLPQTATSKTFTIGQDNKLKLTDAEIAVATAKGWTIA